MRKISLIRSGMVAALAARAPARSCAAVGRADEDYLRPALYAIAPDAPSPDCHEGPRSLTIPMAIREPEPEAITIMMF